MSNMNGRTTKKLYDLLMERDGGYCNFCKTPATEKQLVIDHIDNNNVNNDLYNLQLLCRRCSYIRNHRVSGDTCERYVTETEIQINRKKEPQFRKYVYGIISKDGCGKPKSLINSGAELCGISTTTAKRYLDKICSKNGLCKIFGGFVRINEEHPLFKGEIETYDGQHLVKKPTDDNSDYSQKS